MSGRSFHIHKSSFHKVTDFHRQDKNLLKTVELSQQADKSSSASKISII